MTSRQFTRNQSADTAIATAVVSAGRSIGFGVAVLGLAIYAIGSAWLLTMTAIPWQLPVGIGFAASLFILNALGYVEPISGRKKDDSTRQADSSSENSSDESDERFKEQLDEILRRNASHFSGINPDIQAYNKLMAISPAWNHELSSVPSYIHWASTVDPGQREKILKWLMEHERLRNDIMHG